MDSLLGIASKNVARDYSEEDLNRIFSEGELPHDLKYLVTTHSIIQTGNEKKINEHLTQVIKKYDSEIFDLITENITLNEQTLNEHLRTIASIYPDLSVYDKLINNNDDIKVYNNSVLRSAVGNGNLEFIKNFLKRYPIIDSDLISDASRVGQLEILKYLLKCYPMFKTEDDKSVQEIIKTNLYESIENGYSDSFRYLFGEVDFDNFTKDDYDSLESSAQLATRKFQNYRYLRRKGSFNIIKMILQEKFPEMRFISDDDEY